MCRPLYDPCNPCNPCNLYPYASRYNLGRSYGLSCYDGNRYGNGLGYGLGFSLGYGLGYGIGYGTGLEYGLYGSPYRYGGYPYSRHY